MKAIVVQALIVGVFVLGFVFLVSGCATRVAKEDCLASLPVAVLASDAPIDWNKVQHWNCKK